MRQVRSSYKFFLCNNHGPSTTLEIERECAFSHPHPNTHPLPFQAWKMRPKWPHLSCLTSILSFLPHLPPSKHEKCGRFGCISRVCVSIQSLPHSLHEQRGWNGCVFVLDLTFTLTLAQTRKNMASLAAFSCLGTCLIRIPFWAWKMRPKWPCFSCLAFTSLPLIQTKMWPNRLHFLCCVPIFSLSHISPMSRVLFVYIIVSSHRNIMSSAGKTSTVRFLWNDNILSLSGLKAWSWINHSHLYWLLLSYSPALSAEVIHQESCA